MAAPAAMTTSITGMTGSNLRAFTLVELILVMALLAIVMALAAPSLSRSVRERDLQQEAARFVALTEFGRDEAVSQGVPMVVWIDTDQQRFGVGPKTGFEADSKSSREFALPSAVSIDSPTGAREDNVIEFAPDGTPEPDSIESLRFVDRFESSVLISRTTDGWGYEIAKESR